MRLIDADKLVEICRKGWKLFGREDEKLKHWVDEDDIRNQPTVEAIPIDWLLDYFAYIEDEVFENNLKITKDNIEQLFDELIATWEDEK